MTSPAPGRAVFFQGTLAALAATALGYLGYRAFGWLFWPEIAAQWAFALTPGQIQAPLITALGADAKLLGFYVAMLVQILTGGVLALAARQARPLGRAVGTAALVAVTVLGFRAISPAVQLPAAWPFAAGTVLAAGVFALACALLALPAAGSSGADAPARRWTRRELLGALGTLGGSAALWPWIRADLRRFGPTPTVVQPPPPDLVAALRGGAPDFDRLPRVSVWHTPEPQFYYVSKNLLPHEVALADWGALAVDGLVERPLLLPLDEVQALPRVEMFNTLQCIDFDPYSPLTDDLIGNGLWTGTPLGAVLDRAGVRPEAVDLVFEAGDGYSDSLPVAWVRKHDDVLLVWALNGEPLSARHGYPLRLIIPGQYGMKNVKHLQRVSAVDEDYKGYWQRRGWVDDAPVKTYAKIETLAPDEVLPAGEAAIVAGWAFAGRRGVARVEVSTDNGTTWHGARLEAQRAPHTWVRWALLWDGPAPGRFGVVARATDGDGNLQEARRVAAFPAGTTGHHRVWVDVLPPADDPPEPVRDA